MQKNKIQIAVSTWVVWAMLVACTVHAFVNHKWKQEGLIASDTFSYYAYLPATFIRHDLSMKFLETETDTAYRKFWYSTSATGIRFTKMPMGWAVMNAPFFFMAHMAAPRFGFPANGLSLPYRFAICMTDLLCFCAGLFLLRKYLSGYFKDHVVWMTVLAVAAGTNLYFYAVHDPGYSHPISFFLFACFFVLTEKWHRNPALFNSIGVGFITGLIVLTRPSNAIIILVFIFYQVNSWHALKNKFRSLISRIHLIGIIAFVACIVMIPQLLYWKMVSGHFLFDSYGDEYFYFSHPHLAEGLFGFRKGWLVYTPIMIFAIAGLFFMSGESKRICFSVSVFLFLNTYIILSWWCWWYGGSFGNRAFIESYVILSIPLAALIARAWTKKFLRPVVVTVIILVSALNMHQIQQFRSGIIHYDSMTAEAYKAGFLKTYKPPGFLSMLCHPDYVHAKLGMPERTDCLLHDQNNP